MGDELFKGDELSDLLLGLRKLIKNGSLNDAYLEIVDNGGHILKAIMSKSTDPSDLEISIDGPAYFTGCYTPKVDDRGRVICSSFREDCLKAYSNTDLILLHYANEIVVVPKKFYERHKNFKYKESEPEKFSKSQFDNQGRIMLGTEFVNNLANNTIQIEGRWTPYFTIRYTPKDKET